MRSIDTNIDTIDICQVSKVSIFFPSIDTPGTIPNWLRSGSERLRSDCGSIDIEVSILSILGLKVSIVSIPTKVRYFAPLAHDIGIPMPWLQNISRSSPPPLYCMGPEQTSEYVLWGTRDIDSTKKKNYLRIFSERNSVHWKIALFWELPIGIMACCYTLYTVCVYQLLLLRWYERRVC